MEIADLSETERRVWKAFPAGRVVDLRGGAGPARTVRAQVLKALLLTEPEPSGEVSALRLVGARITGRLDLSHAVVRHPVRLAQCHFEQALCLYGADVRQFNLRESVMPELDAATVQVGGVLRLSGCRILRVRLGGARLAGAVFLDGARIGVERETWGARVLQLDHASVGGSVIATDAEIHGETRLTGLVVAGTVHLSRSRLCDPGGTALNAETVTVGSRLSAGGMQAEGMTDLRGLRGAVLVDLRGAALRHPEGTCLRASSWTVEELLLDEETSITGELVLRRSRIGVIHAPPEVWPDVVRLDGLSYTALNPRSAVAAWLGVLGRDADGQVPSSYEQLSAAYARAGDDVAARTVRLARERRRRSSLVWYARMWGHLQDATVGYGYRPARAAIWLAALLAIGTTVYGLRHPAPLKPGEAPEFSPFFYTLDLLLPVVGLGQEAAFRPVSGYQTLAHLLILAGWVLATTIVAALTRTLTRT
ncbi:membrane-associated oxidoreductase [Actinocorallia aurea]